MNEIYLDNATTTRLDPWVLEEMKPYLTQDFAAPSGHFGYQAALDAKDKLEQARAQIASSINAEPDEIIFTSGGTEANNLAIQGYLKSQHKPVHVVTTAVEHESVLNTLRTLKKQGVEVTEVGVGSDGFIKLDEFAAALKENTALCSVQLVNQEVGTIQPLGQISKICAEKGVPLHTDAVHGWGMVPLDIKGMNLSFAGLSAHKIHGPKGIGALYKKKDVEITPIMYGGYNEFELRPGTENLPGIAGMAKAISMIKPEHIQHIRKMKDKMLNGIRKNIKWVNLNGPLERSAPHILNVTFEYIEGESILLHLDMEGIAAATGSACFSKALEASYVLLAMGRPHEQAHGSMRFSFSRFTAPEDIDKTLAALSRIVADLRKLSPLTPDKEA